MLQLIWDAKQKALTWLKNAEFERGIISILGVAGGNVETGLGKLLVAKLIVKEAMDEGLFDNLIWISQQNEADWSAKNVQMIVMRSLHMINDNAREEEEKIWNEKDVGGRIFSVLMNKKILIVFEDPPSPEKSIDIFGIPVITFSPYFKNRLIILTPYRKVGTLMQTDYFLNMESEEISDVYDLIKEDCKDIAQLERFVVHFSSETVLLCFKSLCLRMEELKDEDFHENILYYWFGEGLLEKGSKGGNLSEKFSIAEELLLEFRRRHLMLIEGGNVSYAIFSLGLYHDILCGDSKSIEGVKWLSLRMQDCRDIPMEYPNASILVIHQGWPYFEEMHCDFFNYMTDLRVLDLSNLPLSTLPTSLVVLSHNLRVLILRECRNMRVFSSVVKSLKSLQILDFARSSLCYSNESLEDNQQESQKLSSSSFSFEHLNNLMLLNLSKNSLLSSLPPYICNLCNLEQLNLSFTTSLTHLPENSFRYMKNLILLDLSSASALQSLPSSISFCINIKTLILKKCSSLKSGISHLHQLLTLETLDLSGCDSLQDISVFNPMMSKLIHLNLSRVTGIVQLSLKGCPSLEEVVLEGCSGLQVLELSNTQIKSFPYEIGDMTALKRVYIQGKLDLLEIDWQRMKPSPQELFYVNDRCESSGQLGQVHKDIQRGKEAFFLLPNETNFFRKYNYSTFMKHFERFHVIISPGFGDGVKGTSSEFQREQFPYKDIYQNLSFGPSSVNLTKLSPNIHVPCIDMSRKGGHLIIDGEIKFHSHLNQIFLCTQFLSLLNNKIVEKLSNFGLEYMKNMKECWLVKCHGMQIVFDVNNESSGSIMPSLEILWISKLSRLTKVCNGRYGGIHLGNLQQISIEYCPKVVDVFTSSHSWRDLRCLRTLKIKFCGRLENVFVGEHMTATGAAKDQEVLFPQLHTLYLWELPSLRRIIGPNMYFPSLKKLNIRGCPKIQKLPIRFNDDVHSNRAKMDIKGEQNWWNNLKWDESEMLINESVKFIGWSPRSKKSDRQLLKYDIPEYRPC